MTALPPDAGRYLVRMRSLDPPIDLVDAIMAEVEATPQVRSAPDLRSPSMLVLAAAAALLAIAVLLRLGAPDVGPTPTPVPLDQLPSAATEEARISIAEGDEPAGFGQGYLWLTNESTGELIRMDPANGSIASPMQVTEASTPFAVAIAETSVWFVDRRDGSLVELDAASIAEERRIPLGVEVTAMALDGSDLWLLSDAGEVLRFDTTAEQVILTVSLDGPRSLLVHAGSVWVGMAPGRLARLDPATGDETATIELGFVPERLIAAGDSILAFGSGADQLTRIEASSLQVRARGPRVLAVAAADNRVWAVLASRHLVRLDPETLQPVQATSLDVGEAGALAVGSGSLWTTGLDTAGDAYVFKLAPEQ